MSSGRRRDDDRKPVRAYTSGGGGRNRRPRKQSRFDEPSEATSSDSSVSNDAASSTSAGPMNIPGFYWDAVKNRYFKIVANKGATPSSSQYTFEAIKAKAAAVQRDHVAEQIRKKRLEELAPIRRNRSDYLHTSLSSFLRDREASPSLHQLSGSLQRSRAMESMMKYLRVRSTIKNAGGQTAGSGFVMQNGDITDFRMHPFMNEVCTGHTDGSVRMMTFQPRNVDGKGPTSYEQATGFLARQENSEITSLNYGYCRYGDISTIVTTSLGYGGRPGSVQANSKMSVYSSAVSISSCSRGETVLAIGAQGKLVVIKDWEDRNEGASVRHIPLPSKTDVLSQAFDADGTLLLNGCRDGRIHAFDLRTHGIVRAAGFGEGQNHPAMFKGRHASAICCLQALSSQRLLSAAMDGSMYMWDLRNSRVPVLEFVGQVNTHTKLNFTVDHEESVFVTPGQDRYIRTWSLRTGTLLSQIPPANNSNNNNTTNVGPSIVRFMNDPAANLGTATGDATTMTDCADPPLLTRTEGMLWEACGADIQIWGAE
ncbi:WD40-repeat-containing domain protein [Powellomyces hirtus]|nr:WD40-repeat-containing domain protein [Powellomyces hirtus]